MTHARLRAASGFTLLEIVVVVAISAVMCVVLVDVYRAYTRLYGVQKIAADTAGSASTVANELQEWVLQADRILTSNTYSGAVYTTGTSTLVLELPSIDSSGNAISGTYDSVIFYTSGTNVYRVLSPNATSVRTANTKTLSNKLAYLSLTYNNTTLTSATQITAVISMTSTEGRETAQYQVTQKLYLRNL